MQNEEPLASSQRNIQDTQVEKMNKVLNSIFKTAFRKTREACTCAITSAKGEALMVIYD